MRQLHIIPALLLALVLSACASLATPETPAERLAYVDGQFTAAVNTASDLRDAGIITPEQAEDIDPYIKQGNQALNLAWAALAAERPESALEYMRAVNRLLLALRAELQEARQ